MKHKFYSLILTTLLGLTGMKAWALDQKGGVYQIGTAQDLVNFASLVNGGTTGANAVLTDDIDLDGVTWTPIGNGSNIYTGTFDGQGHAITNFVYEAVGDNNGLFGCIDGIAVVKDFSISGTLTSGFTYNGVVGQAEGNSIISDVYSLMDINVSNCKAHTGGIVGGMSTSSKMEIHNCEYAGTLTHSGSGDCQAGICGYTYGGGIFNCVFSGTIVGESSKYGGILGYCKVPGFKGVKNCLSIGTIIANENCTTAAAIIANWNGTTTTNVKNNYYCLQEGSTTTFAIGNKAESCEAPIEVTTEQLESGEVCYKLNGEQTVINWFQTLGEDLYPVLDNTHKLVSYSKAEGYTNEQGGGITGDLNGDGKVDIADAVTVLNFMATEGNEAAADLNGDQKVDIADFVAILGIMVQNASCTTGNVVNITENSAVITCSYNNIGGYECGVIISCDRGIDRIIARSIDGEQKIILHGLLPAVKYEYCAYVDVDGTIIKGETKSFTTEFPDLSRVWTFKQTYYAAETIYAEFEYERSDDESVTYKSYGFFGVNRLSCTFYANRTIHIYCYSPYGNSASFYGYIDDYFTSAKGDGYYYGLPSYDWANPGWDVDDPWTLSR